jgi:hypothetical protein
LDKPGPKPLSAIVFWLFAGALFGVLLGGVYSLPAINIAKEREPWLSLLLSLGLAVTVFGLGCLLHTPLAYSVGVWVLTIGLLQLARLSFGLNPEHFGFVHVAAVVITYCVSVAAKVAARSATH